MTVNSEMVEVRHNQHVVRPLGSPLALIYALSSLGTNMAGLALTLALIFDQQPKRVNRLAS